YDLPFVWMRYSEPFSDVLLVYVDESSIARYSAPGSFVMNRAAHTRLLNRLTDEGAKLVFYDFIFDTESADPRVDQEFAQAMKRHGSVVLGAAFEEFREKDTLQTRILAPNPVLRAAAKAWG